MVTTALVGAGVVALGAGAALDDAKGVDAAALKNSLDNASATAEELAEREASAERSTRDSEREESAEAGLATSLSESPDAWLLPLHGYDFTAPYGVRWGEVHPGIDLAAREGTAYKAVHGGTVKLAGWYGGYGYAVIVDHGDGVETIYGHSSQLMVQVGQQVKAGDTLGLVGDTGHSYGSHLHLEIHVDGAPRDPVPFLRDQGVDIQLEVEQVYGAVTAS
ncbi:murein DD-endopeptidase MepM/ murein hydrolase activator NlpD [Catenuloplanes atrovinosus]|uniref:Murein DD-endopeptidase MepM/ murein hydrolase activator NlpD n=1 Tax=Catenuloplanes atrovinosus TaxID=137266 RepID=A0AAE4CCK9_9ACTN|nr:murein DD-endopeptidase MepM/ murein hydrolase activator NlpD [Catenuloplanes atrovinosus]